MTSPEDNRRSFASRTPENTNPEKVAYRRGFVTRHQVSGWRFVMRRIASGVALHDTRMLVDPLRSQSRAVVMGVLILITGIIGCFIFSLIRPGGVAGNDAILADRTTAALYVRLGDELHPVLNLTSARLIAGRADNPTTVKTSEIDRFPRGSLVGIPGAPERMVQNSSRDADWTVCEGLSGPASGGQERSDRGIDTGVTVVAGPLASDGNKASGLASDQAILVRNDRGAWLLWNGRRSLVDLNNRAITGALGLGTERPEARPVAAGLLNAIPEGPSLVAPVIPGAGEPPRFPLPVPAPVGAVVVSQPTAESSEYYAVLPDGLQPITPVLAAVLRNTNSLGLVEPPQLSADEVARAPISRLIDTDQFPADPVSLVDAAGSPVTCAHWAKADDSATSALTVLSGSALPVADSARAVNLVSAGRPGVANKIVVSPGRGWFVQTVGQEPGSPTAESTFWIADTGVRYGIDTTGDQGDKVVSSLGLTPPPVPIPWSFLSLFAAGPALSRADALVAHDGLEAQ